MGVIRAPQLLPCEKKALALLEHHKILGAELVRVSPGIILFTQPRDAKDELKDAWTAWTDETGGELLRLDRGFIADY